MQVRTVRVLHAVSPNCSDAVLAIALCARRAGHEKENQLAELARLSNLVVSFQQSIMQVSVQLQGFVCICFGSRLV